MFRVTGGSRHETRYFFGCTTSVPRLLQQRNMVCLNERSELRKMWRPCGMLLTRARVDLQYAMLKLWGCLTLLFGVLTVRLETPCFFVAEAMVRKLCTQRSNVFRDGILPWRGTSKCRRNFLCVTITDSPFLKTSPRGTLGYEGSTAPWQLKLQNLTLLMIPVPWQLYATPSYTSLSKNVRFRWRTLYVKLVLILAEDIRCVEYNIKMKWNIYFVKHNYIMFHSFK